MCAVFVTAGKSNIAAVCYFEQKKQWPACFGQLTYGVACCLLSLSLTIYLKYCECAKHTHIHLLPV